jgi:hypothetical protein
MNPKYHARWISKRLADSLRKVGGLTQSVLVGHFHGYIIIEPVGRRLGDGKVLARDAADYELRAAWCQESRATLTRARRLLGLEPEPRADALLAVG